MKFFGLDRHLRRFLERTPVCVVSPEGWVGRLTPEDKNEERTWGKKSVILKLHFTNGEKMDILSVSTVILYSFVVEEFLDNKTPLSKEIQPNLLGEEQGSYKSLRFQKKISTNSETSVNLYLTDPFRSSVQARGLRTYTNFYRLLTDPDVVHSGQSVI